MKPIRSPQSERFPAEIGSWRQVGDDVRFDDETEKVLRVDNYHSRNFVSGGRAIFLCWLLCDATERRNLSQSAKLSAQFRMGHEPMPLAL